MLMSISIPMSGPCLPCLGGNLFLSVETIKNYQPTRPASKSSSQGKEIRSQKGVRSLLMHGGTTQLRLPPIPPYLDSVVLVAGAWLAKTKTKNPKLGNLGLPTADARAN